MITLSGLMTAIRRTARVFRSSRSEVSRTPISMVLSFLVTPIMSQKVTIDSGVKPRRRIPEMVSMRGSSQPLTCPSVTSWLSLRLLVSEYSSCRRANSVWNRARRGLEVI